MNDLIRERIDDLHDRVDEVLAEVKPRLRGWIHLGVVPLTLAAGIVLIALSPTAPTRVASAVFAASALLLFGVSAIYHRGNWSPRLHGFWQRFDHANIFLLIAGSYTPFTLLLLDGRERVVMLAAVWSAAILGVLFRVFWVNAPRWLYVPIYIGMGWAALLYLPGFIDGAGDAGARHRDRHARPGRGRRAPLHRSAGWSTASSVPTRGRAGSGSTRSSTPSPSWRSSATTSASRWRRTPCAEPGPDAARPPGR